MFNIYAKTKFAQLGNQLLMVGLFMAGTLLFSYSNADSGPTGEPINESKIENPYFMDFDSLQEHLSSDWHSGDLVYEQKGDPETIWIFLPITNLMLAHYRTVAAVLAPALQKKLDASAAVPPTKFVVQKRADGQGYKLLGCAYQEFSSADSSMEDEIEEAQARNEYISEVFYKNHKLERHMLHWDFLGLPNSPDIFVMSEDNKLLRYDYDNAFRYRISDDDLKASDRCSKYLSFRNHQCDLEYIKIFRQEIRARYRTNLQEVISEMSAIISQYLKEKDLNEVNKALREIVQDFGSE